MAVANVVQWLKSGRRKIMDTTNTIAVARPMMSKMTNSAGSIGQPMCVMIAIADRREAERENDSDAGRQVVARRARLKPFAYLSV